MYLWGSNLSLYHDTSVKTSSTSSLPIDTYCLVASYFPHAAAVAAASDAANDAAAAASDAASATASAAAASNMTHTDTADTATDAAATPSMRRLPSVESVLEWKRYHDSKMRRCYCN
mmetsp:Transcript_22059/g.47735  ORF Transcript_22059/g.47735 Transcript_22059/m.47735 type:complete len:117 (-) Transcript_22059:565-915(-)